MDCTIILYLGGDKVICLWLLVFRLLQGGGSLYGHGITAASKASLFSSSCVSVLLLTRRSRHLQPADIRETRPERFSYCWADLSAVLRQDWGWRRKNRERERAKEPQLLPAQPLTPNPRVGSRRLWFVFSDRSRVRGHADGDHLHGLRARESGGRATGQFQQPPQSRGVPAHRESRPITVALPPTSCCQHKKPSRLIEI